MPFYIRQLDFKSKEELQQMPQTEEEHLENQNLDNDDSDRSQPDAEVSFSFQCVYALLNEANENYVNYDADDDDDNEGAFSFFLLISNNCFLFFYDIHFGFVLFCFTFRYVTLLRCPSLRSFS